MAITGMHTLLYSSEPEALRAVLADVFGWDHVDDGQDAGWLIFKTPPAEMGVHPGEKPGHQISFMCDDLDATMAELGNKGVRFKDDPTDEGWGIVVTMVLPGDVEVMLYQPRHNVAI